MSRPPKTRIAIDPAQTGLNSAFSDALTNLDTSSLPMGEVMDSPQEETHSKKGRVVLRRETAHRGGKTVVIISDFAIDIPEGEIDDLGRQLRKACGCGGTTANREIEIQGDQVPRIRMLLEAEGFRVDGVR